MLRSMYGTAIPIDSELVNDRINVSDLENEVIFSSLSDPEKSIFVIINEEDKSCGLFTSKEFYENFINIKIKDATSKQLEEKPGEEKEKDKENGK